MSQAEHHFVETLRQGDTKKTSGDTILSLLHNAEINLERMKEEEQKLPPEDGKVIDYLLPPLSCIVSILKG